MFTKIILVQPHKAKSSRRQRELQMAEIKAHAARISHVKNKLKQQPADQETSSLRHDQYSPRLPTLNDFMPQTLIGCTHKKSFHQKAWPAQSTLLSQEKYDPFHSGQTRELPAALLRSLDYAFEVIWPKNTPFLQGKSLEIAVRDWRTQGVQSELQAHAQICAAASLGLVLSQDPATARILTSVRNTYQVKSYRLIYEAIDSLAGPPSLDLLTAIMQISVSGQGDLSPVIVDSLPKSPIYKAFNAELYERFSPIGYDQHYRAIAVLIEQRGGLEALPPGLAHQVLLEDVQRASHRLGKPFHPLPKVLAHHRLTPWPDADAEDLLAVLGSGFHFRPFDQRDGRLRIMIQQASEFTAALDQYQRNSPFRCRLSELATQAVIIQHRLLSLPAVKIDSAETPSQQETQYYEIARISVIIYAGIVVQPHVSAPLLRQRQTKMLQTQLLFCFQHLVERGAGLAQLFSINSDFNKLLLWALILGTIATFPATSETRGWYVNHLRTYVSARRLTWDEFKDEAHSFLFWDYVMAKTMKDICVEENVFSW